MKMHSMFGPRGEGINRKSASCTHHKEREERGERILTEKKKKKKKKNGDIVDELRSLEEKKKEKEFRVTIMGAHGNRNASIQSCSCVVVTTKTPTDSRKSLFKTFRH